MRKPLLLLLSLLAGIWACGPEAPSDANPPDLSECAYEKVEDWEAVIPLNWSDSLPERSRFKTFEELLEGMTGNYDVKSGSIHGTLKVLRGEGHPYQKFDGTNCANFFYLPVHLELVQDTKIWAETVSLNVAYEHLGYTTDREVPEPKTWSSASGRNKINDIESFPSFNAKDSFPKIEEDEMLLEVSVKVTIFPKERLVLEIEAVVSVSGGVCMNGDHGLRLRAI